VEHVDHHGRDEGEGEQEGGAEPVDDCLGRVEVGGRMACDGREGEPLVSTTVSKVWRIIFSAVKMSLVGP
jgi:hypothetical protein